MAESTVNSVVQGGDTSMAGNEERKSYQYNNNCFYDGTWLGNRRHGHGTFKWPSGSYYEGNFKADLRDGKGKITY